MEKDVFVWGLIGASTIAQEFMVDAIRASRGTPLWVVSGSAERAAGFAEQCSIPFHSTKLGEMLADPRVRAVYVSSANTFHAGQVIAAAQAGKHVLCDKPMATTISDARAMIDACAAAGVVLAVNHHLRAAPIHQTMRQMIASGEIGTVRAMQIVFAGSLRPVLQTWRITDPDEGGIYLDLSVHDIDLARFVLQQDFISVIGQGATVALGAQGVHDQTMYSAEISAGISLQVMESFVTPNAESRVQIYGTTGILTATGTLRQEAAGSLVLRRNGEDHPIPCLPADLYLETIWQMLAAIETGSQPLASGADGLASLTGALAVKQSAERGERVSLQTMGGGYR